jgi:prepilin-type N-terminal cleavage/methylation domain-containing protein
MTRSHGFTLIELLVVMAIVAALAGLGLVGIQIIIRHGHKTAAKTFLSSLSATLEAYRSTEGAYPPTSLKDFSGVGPSNDENCGIEAVVLCLNSPRSRTQFEFSGVQGCKLENFDGDQTQAQLTRFDDVKQLFEAVDPWGTPYAYFNAQDYGRAADFGKIALRDGATIRALPWRDAKTKAPFRSDSFQIISAGPDGEFNTDDDIVHFERE